MNVADYLVKERNKVTRKLPPPSYADVGKPKPIKEGRTKELVLPIRVVVCKRCHRPGGTLVKSEKGYYHEECK